MVLVLPLMLLLRSNTGDEALEDDVVDGEFVDEVRYEKCVWR